MDTPPPEPPSPPPADCPSSVDLERFARGETVPDDVRRHVETCPHCRASVTTIRANNALLSEIVAAQAQSTPTPGAGDRPEVAGYEIHDVIHAGGQGVVFRATQLAPHRDVALKVLLGGRLATTKQRLRFEREIELVAALRHPNIVVIHDTGTTTDGQPYFTMEYVEGLPLTQYARETDLSTRERLRLVAAICRAVQHAHRHGIIHRDLKPANILVTNAGEPKVLDFGVARATDSDIQVTSEATDVGALIGTVPYMSPEQVLGIAAEIDVRSDVYALGVIAYELLTGSMPYDLERKMIHEAVRVIREDDPAPLSSIDRVFRGDVETIVAKALEKSRARRYQSADALAADIDRYLADEPIEAHPPSAVYQLRKFARRHRATVIGGSAVAAALLIGTVVSTILAVSAIRARDAARASERVAVGERDASEAVTGFLETAIADVKPWQQGRDVLMRDVLEGARLRLDDLDERPVVEARLHGALGGAFQALGDFDAAERHVRDALALRQAASGPEAPETVAAMLDLANVLDTADRVDAARTLLEDALAIQTRVAPPDDPLTLRTQMMLGRHWLFRAEFDKAAPLLRAARDGWRTREGPAHPATLNAMDLLAFLALSTGDTETAEEALSDILDAHRDARGDAHPETLTATNSLGVFLLGQARYDEAEPLFRELSQQQGATWGDDDVRTIAARAHLASAVEGQSRYDEAETILRDLIERTRRGLGPEHPETAMAERRLADFHASRERYADAERAYLSVIAASRNAVGDAHVNTYSTVLRLAALYEVWDRPADAEARFLEALELSRVANKGALRQTIPYLQAVIGFYERAGRPLEAAPYQDELSTLMTDAAAPPPATEETTEDQDP